MHIKYVKGEHIKKNQTQSPTKITSSKSVNEISIGFFFFFRFVFHKRVIKIQNKEHDRAREKMFGGDGYAYGLDCDLSCVDTYLQIH